jgi:hypothetical protein
MARCKGQLRLRNRTQWQPRESTGAWAFFTGCLHKSACCQAMDERDLVNLWPVLLAAVVLGAGIALLMS